MVDCVCNVFITSRLVSDGSTQISCRLVHKTDDLTGGQATEGGGGGGLGGWGGSGGWGGLSGWGGQGADRRGGVGLPDGRVIPEHW